MMLVFNFAGEGQIPHSELSFSNPLERYVTHCKTNCPEDGDSHSEFKTRIVAISGDRNYVFHGIHRVVHRPATWLEGLANGYS